MTEPSVTSQHVLPAAVNTYDDEIDLRELFVRLWAQKRIILLSGIIATAIAVGIALWLPNIYRAQALLAPAEENTGGGLSALASQFGGLASLAGINLPTGETNKTTIAIEALKSRTFLTRFIRKYNLSVPIMAAKGWDQSTGELIIDPEIYDVDTKHWVRDVQPPFQPEPSDWELYKAFKELLSVSEDKKTGLIKVSIDYYSPGIAKEWVDWLVAEINQYMKERDVTDAQKKIAYLQAQIEKTPIADMQRIFYNLIEQQTKIIMLANVQDEYVFKTLDPAVEPLQKIRPKRSLMVIVGATIGAMIGIIFALLRGRETTK